MDISYRQPDNDDDRRIFVAMTSFVVQYTIAEVALIYL